MFLLTKGNIRIITETIDKAEITFSHLRDDLIDHMCCEIETEMQSGLDFKNALAKIKKHVGIKDLQKVQEKTILLIDKNYCTMKKTMKISGIISIALIMFGSLFKIQHWPGAGTMLTLGFFSLCVLFLPSANYVMHRQNKDRSLILLFLSVLLGSIGYFAGILFKIQHWPGANILIALGCLFLCVLFFPLLLRFLIKNASSRREKIIYTISVFSGMIFMAGFLFKMMHWPGAGILLLVGSASIVALFLPLYTRLKYAQSEKIEASFLYIIAALTWFILFTFLISVSVSRNILKEFIDVEHNNQTTINYLKQKDESIVNNLKGTKVDSIISDVKVICSDLDNYIQNLKIEIIQNMPNESQHAIYEGNKININMILDKTNMDVPFSILIGEDSNGKAFELHKKIDEVKEKIELLVDKDDTTSKLIQTCLNTDLPASTPEWIKSWEMLYFNHTTVVGSVNVLTCIQRNLKIAENEAINYIVNQ